MAITGSGGRPIGLPKTGGRKKGRPNRATLTLREKLDEIGCDPLIELAKIAMDKKKSDEIRVRCFSEIAAYIYPRPKPIDLSSDQPSVPTFITNLDPGNSDAEDQHNPSA